MSALRLINETSGTSVSSISVTDVFSADFDIYQITINNSDITIKDYSEVRFINSSGSVVAASNYDNAQLDMHGESAFSEIRGTNADSTGLAFAMTNDLEPEGISNSYYFFNPYSSSSYSFGLWQSEGVPSGGGLSIKGIGVLKQTASMTGIQFYNVSFTDISVKCYGLRVDS